MKRQSAGSERTPKGMQPGVHYRVLPAGLRTWWFRRIAIVMLLVLVTLVVTLGGCRARGEADFYAYLREPAGAQVRGEVNGFRYTAQLQYNGPRKAGDDGQAGADSVLPDFSLCFTEPETLRGVVLSCWEENGEQVWQVRLGEVCVRGDFRNMAAGVTELLHEDAIQRSTRVEKTIRGETETRIEVRTQSGVVYDLDPDTGYPLALRTTAGGRAISLEIDWQP